MQPLVAFLHTMKPGQRSHAGGKGGTLAKLKQAGYPVPMGFVIFPAAFEEETLTVEAWPQVKSCLARMRESDDAMAFAVRSSAMREDAAQASFAGEFETVLDVRSDVHVREAIHTVRRSRHAERVRAYGAVHGMHAEHEIAVVVQKLIRAEYSGVLFTAEPVSGSHVQMLGNFVHGFGEALVSGEAEASSFILRYPKGQYEGPPELKRYARRLFRLARSLERDLECPQDIEWAVADGKLHLLQSRPITTLREVNPRTYDWNSSFTGDYLWARQEPFPEVVTPSTWSLWKQTYLNARIAGVSGMGNIGGRIYLNISLPYALMLKMGKEHADATDLFDAIVSPLPAGVEIPTFPLAWMALLRELLPQVLTIGLKQSRLKREVESILANAPAHCQQASRQIEAARERQMLITLWYEEALIDRFNDMMLLLDAMTEDYRGTYLGLKRDLGRLLEPTQVHRLMANISGGSQDLTTMGPLVGLHRLVQGEMSRQDYASRYGHRHANENELAQARPYEDPNWLSKEIEAFKKNPVDINALLHKQSSAFEALWSQFAQQHPKRANPLRKDVEAFMLATHKREAVRGEVTRLVGLLRLFFLRAGALLGLGDDVFLLTCEELLGALGGDDAAIALLPLRRETYERYKALPPYPNWIRGRFDPVIWAADPNRRSDFYDAQAPGKPSAREDTLRGHPGSAGSVEGIVRCIESPEEGDQFLQGEILVAVTTNVGWTPLFPRAAAVVTDIGAPLAHAAIVARELGIPAVVGCSDATARLRSGDRVRVDGGAGFVEILERRTHDRD